MNELSLAVVGLDFPNPDKGKSNRRFEMALCAPGERVSLVPEPKNKADHNAIAIFSMRGVQLGYLTAERCGWIKGRMAQGEEHEAVFQEQHPSAAIIRVRFGGGSPSLPPQAARRRSDQGFGEWYEGDAPFDPDPEPPEWGA